MNKRTGLIATGVAAVALLAACTGVISQRQNTATLGTTGGALIAAPPQQSAPAAEQLAPAIEAPKVQVPAAQPAESKSAAGAQTSSSSASSASDVSSSTASGGHQCERENAKTASVDD
jgi:hypothetical protein